MPCDKWFQMEKIYRLAVHHYCDAVDRLDITRDFPHEWERVTAASMAAERARFALLRHQSEHVCLGSGVLSFPETEDLVLGDQGQPGG